MAKAKWVVGMLVILALAAALPLFAAEDETEVKAVDLKSIFKSVPDKDGLAKKASQAMKVEMSMNIAVPGAGNQKQDMTMLNQAEYEETIRKVDGAGKAVSIERVYSVAKQEMDIAGMGAGIPGGPELGDKSYTGKLLVFDRDGDDWSVTMYDETGGEKSETEINDLDRQMLETEFRSREKMNAMMEELVPDKVLEVGQSWEVPMEKLEKALQAALPADGDNGFGEIFTDIKIDPENSKLTITLDEIKDGKIVLGCEGTVSGKGEHTDENANGTMEIEMTINVKGKMFGDQKQKTISSMKMAGDFTMKMNMNFGGMAVTTDGEGKYELETFQEYTKGME